MGHYHTTLIGKKMSGRKTALVDPAYLINKQPRVYTRPAETGKWWINVHREHSRSKMKRLLLLLDLCLV